MLLSSAASFAVSSSAASYIVTSYFHACLLQPHMFLPIHPSSSAYWHISCILHPIARPLPSWGCLLCLPISIYIHCLRDLCGFCCHLLCRFLLSRYFFSVSLYLLSAHLLCQPPCASYPLRPAHLLTLFACSSQFVPNCLSVSSICFMPPPPARLMPFVSFVLSTLNI